jgi:hypothetical protein
MSYSRNNVNTYGGLYSRPIKNRLTPRMLVSMHEEMQKYKKVYEEGYSPSENLTCWLKDRGALTEKGVVIKNYTKSEYKNGTLVTQQDCSPIEYEQLVLDWEQYQYWHTVKRKRHEVGFCYCEECCKTLDFNITPVKYFL